MLSVKTILTSTLILLATPVSAGALVQGGYFQNYSNYQDDDSDNFIRESMAHVVAAGQVAGWAAGACYHFEEMFYGGEQQKLEAYGPTIGYMSESLGTFALGTYLINPRLTYSDSSDKSYGGSGYIAEVGKIWKVYGQLSAGVELVRTQIIFKKEESTSSNTGDVTTTEKTSKSIVTKPMVSAVYAF